MEKGKNKGKKTKAKRKRQIRKTFEHPGHFINGDSVPTWPPTVRPSQTTWTVTQPQRNDNYCRIHHRPFITTQPESSYTFYRPTEGWKAESI